jgi:hypothetical protein
LKKTIIILVSLLLTAATAGAQPPERSQFKYISKVNGSFIPGSPARIVMGSEIIWRTSLDFSDLRLFDSRGQEAPYVIYRQKRPGRSAESFSFKVKEFIPGEKKSWIVLERPAKTGPFNRLDIKTPAKDFERKVMIDVGTRAGRGPITWRQVKEDRIFDYSSQVDLRKTTVDLGPTDSNFVRLRLVSEGKNSENGQVLSMKYNGLDLEMKGTGGQEFRISGVTGSGGVSVAEQVTYDRKFIRPGMNLDADGNSVFDLANTNIPVTRLTFTVPANYYYRRVEVWASDDNKTDSYRLVGSGNIYNLPDLDKPHNQVTVKAVSHRNIKIKVINGDNPPFDINGIHLEWPRRILYFMPEKGKSYTLFFGAGEMKAPVYGEISRIIPDAPEKLQSVRTVGAGMIKDNPGYEPVMSGEKKDRIEKMVLTLVILLLVLALSFWLFKLMQKLPEEDTLKR